LLKAFNLQFDRGHKFFAKPKASRLVPIVRFAHFAQRPSRKL
jgi:hypothetical protein